MTQVAEVPARAGRRGRGRRRRGPGPCRPRFRGRGKPTSGEAGARGRGAANQQGHRHARQVAATVDQRLVSAAERRDIPGDRHWKYLILPLQLSTSLEGAPAAVLGATGTAQRSTTCAAAAGPLQPCRHRRSSGSVSRGRQRMPSTSRTEPSQVDAGQLGLRTSSRHRRRPPPRGSPAWWRRATAATRSAGEENSRGREDLAPAQRVHRRPARPLASGVRRMATALRADTT